MALGHSDFQVGFHRSHWVREHRKKERKKKGGGGSPLKGEKVGWGGGNRVGGREGGWWVMCPHFS